MPTSVRSRMVVSPSRTRTRAGPVPAWWLLSVRQHTSTRSSGSTTATAKGTAMPRPIPLWPLTTVATSSLWSSATGRTTTRPAVLYLTARSVSLRPSSGRDRGVDCRDLRTRQPGKQHYLSPLERHLTQSPTKYSSVRFRWAADRFWCRLWGCFTIRSRVPQGREVSSR